MNRSALLAVVLLAACTSEPDAADAPGKKAQDGKVTLVSKQPIDAARAAEQACTRLTFEDVLLTHCLADPARHRIRTALGPEGGAPYRGLGALAQARTGQEPQVVFAMNGGMFDDRGEPIGYYVEGGRRLARLNRNDGPGNFHLKPNGVFYGTGGTWAVHTSDWFAEHVSQRPDFATQSGPMLVIDGAIHPRFDEDGESKFIRNAVGVDEDGRAHFVISEMPISFGKLARFYRDELEVPDALYLDGNVSALWYPMGARIDASPPLGPLIVVEKRAKAVAGPSAADDVDDSAGTQEAKTDE